MNRRSFFSSIAAAIGAALLPKAAAKTQIWTVPHMTVNPLMGAPYKTKMGAYNALRFNFAIGDQEHAPSWVQGGTEWMEEFNQRYWTTAHGIPPHVVDPRLIWGPPE